MMASKLVISNNQRERPVRSDYDVVSAKDLDENDDEAVNDDETISKPKMTHIRSCSDLHAWLKIDTLSKLPFICFYISLFIPFILMIWYFGSANSAYIVSGIFGIGISFYGFFHFRTLFSLSNTIDKYAQLNLTFAKENVHLRHEVDKLKGASQELSGVHHKLSALNEKQRYNLAAFRDIEENMKLANLNNIDGINSIRNRAKKIRERWKEAQKQKERVVLFTVFDRFEHDKQGMNRTAFEEFVKLIPCHYKERFDRLGTFDKISRGNGYIDDEDFKLCLDVFAEMGVADVDIDFKIKVVRQPSAHPDEMPIFVRQVDIIHVTRRPTQFVGK